MWGQPPSAVRSSEARLALASRRTAARRRPRRIRPPSGRHSPPWEQTKPHASCNQIAPSQLYLSLESDEVATLNSTSFAISAPQSDTSLRTLAELTIGFAAILVVLWLPTREQLIF